MFEDFLIKYNNKELPVISCQFIALTKYILTQTDRVRVKKAPTLVKFDFFHFLSISCHHFEKISREKFKAHKKRLFLGFNRNFHFGHQC